MQNYSKVSNNRFLDSQRKIRAKDIERIPSEDKTFYVGSDGSLFEIIKNEKNPDFYRYMLVSDPRYIIEEVS